MKKEIKNLFRNWRIWLLIFFLLLSLLAINYQFFESEGVVISGVGLKTPAANAGITFKENTPLTKLEKINFINDKPIKSLNDYYNILNSIPLTNKTSIIIKTNKNPNGYLIKLSNISINNTKNSSKYLISKIIGMSVREKPKTNLHLGIELEGGTRLILEPEDNLSDENFNILIQNLRNRLDIYGASGTKVNKIIDSFTGKKYILIESPSSNKEDILKLITHQGNFEAKLGNTTVFTGKDIVMVYSDPQHSGLDRCGYSENNRVYCRYRFQVQISSKAAEKFLEAAKKLSVVTDSNGEKYLSEKITFYLDDKNITSLNVAASFKNEKITSPTITITGEPALTLEEAKENGKKEMKFLQALLSTETLNTKLKVVQSYEISSSIGKKLLQNSLLIGILAILAVAGVIALRYRNIIIFTLILITLVSELILILGISAFMKLTIDLAAIGGLIAAIGTGVDDQIIIIDEYLRKDNKNLKKKKKIKKAFLLIMMSYFTTVVAMIPISIAGLKILQGFAVTIILGVTIGVLITRPVFGVMVEHLIDKKK